MGFSRQEYWNESLCPPPGNLPNPGIEPTTLVSSAPADRFFTTKATWEAQLKSVKRPQDQVVHSSLLLLLLLSRFSHVQLFAILWTVAHQAPLSRGFSRQEYWSGLPCPPPGNLPNPGIEPTSLTSPALAGRFFTTSATWETPVPIYFFVKCEQRLLHK